MPKITAGVQPDKGLCGKQPSRSNFSDKLVQLEEQIRNGQADYAAVGTALTEIQSARLYKARYNTFEEYCEKQWGFTRDAAYDYINACGVLRNVELTPQNHPSLTQAVQLSRLSPEQQKEIALRLDFVNATVREVRVAVDALLGKPPAPEPREPREIQLEDALDAFVTKIALQPYGHASAKFSKYPEQHTVDLSLIELRKWTVYEQLQVVVQNWLTARQTRHESEK